MYFCTLNMSVQLALFFIVSIFMKSLIFSKKLQVPMFFEVRVEFSLHNLIMVFGSY